MSRARIAVVDDDPLVLKVMNLLLKVKGYDAILRSEAATACAMIQQEQPDLVLLDLLMQGDQNAGLNVVECLHADPATRTIPVIIVSATADTLRGADRRLSELSYARLLKPAATEELYQLIASALALKQTASPGQQDREEQAASDAAHSPP